jgi:hypothetical protein
LNVVQYAPTNVDLAKVYLKTSRAEGKNEEVLLRGLFGSCRGSGLLNKGVDLEEKKRKFQDQVQDQIT